MHEIGHFELEPYLVLNLVFEVVVNIPQLAALAKELKAVGTDIVVRYNQLVELLEHLRLHEVREISLLFFKFVHLIEVLRTLALQILQLFLCFHPLSLPFFLLPLSFGSSLISTTLLIFFLLKLKEIGKHILHVGTGALCTLKQTLCASASPSSASILLLLFLLLIAVLPPLILPIHFLLLLLLLIVEARLKLLLLLVQFVNSKQFMLEFAQLNGFGHHLFRLAIVPKAMVAGEQRVKRTAWICWLGLRSLRERGAEIAKVFAEIHVYGASY